MSTLLNQILDRLSDLPDLTSFSAIIDTIRAIYDVDHVNYYAQSLGVDSRAAEEQIDMDDECGLLLQRGRKFAMVSYRPDWMERYLAGRFYDFDPVLQTASTSFDPIDWDDIDTTERNNCRFMFEAADAGVGNRGYTIPVRGPGGQFATFTVNKECSGQDWKRLLSVHCTDFLLLAHFIHQRVLKLAGLGHQHTTRPLSSREKDAMRLIAAGLSRGRASERLGISENTFRVYMDSARHKLGALNVPHAIAIAAHRGLIHPD